MTTTPFTKGPWRLWNGWGPLISDGLHRCVRIGPDGEGGIQAPPGMDMKATRADFELAAAAPDLYEVCRQLVSYRDEARERGAHGLPQWVLDIADAAQVAMEAIGDRH